MASLTQAEPIIIVVYGDAQPAGSKRGFAFKRQNGSTGVAISDANPKSRDWKTQVSQAAGSQYGGDLLRGPIELTLRFFKPRPKSHYTSKGLITKSAPDEWTSKPDVLKLARGVEDSLSGIVYADDAQIVDEHLQKRFGSPARCEIEIRELQF